MGWNIRLGAGFERLSISSPKSSGESPIFGRHDDWNQRIRPLRSIVAGFNDDLAMIPNGIESAVYDGCRSHAPNEIFSRCLRVPVSGCKSGHVFLKVRIASCTKAIPLTHLNDAILSQIAMSPLESFWFTGAHNDKVQGFLVKPPNFDRHQEISREVPDSRRAAGRVGRRLELSLESRTVRARNRIRGHHDQLPRLDRIRAEVHRCHQRRLGRRSV